MRNEGFGLGVHCPYIALKISGGLSATGVRPIISMELLSLALVTSRVRKTEKVAFGSVPASTSYLSSKKLRMAAKMSKSQGEVWDHVAETQANLSESLGKSLFAKLWSKLLDAAVLEAIAESHRNVRKGEQSVTADSIRDWFNEASQGAIFDRRGVPPRVVVSTRRAERGVEFATFDHRLDEALLHQNFVAN